MGVSAFDSEPDLSLGNTMKRDEFLSADDRFMWTMDTFLDQQTGYFFEMNPSGLMADQLMRAGGGWGTGMGRHLGCICPSARGGLDPRDRDSVSHAELRPGRTSVGSQLPAHRPEEERGERLDRP